MRPDLPHQASALAWALARKSIALFVAMRLGKTHITIRWAQHWAPNGIKLVVAPVGTHASWCDELEADDQKYLVLEGSSVLKCRQLDQRRKDRRWIVVSPEGLRSCPAILDGLQVSVVILDESLFIANPRAKVTKLIQRRLGRVPFRAVLAGEPQPEGLHQLYEQMRFVCGGSWMGAASYWVWRLRYFYEAGFKWLPYPATETKVEQELKRLTYAQSADDYHGKSQFMRRHVDMPPRLRTIYRKAWKDMELGDAWTKWTPVVRNWLSQLAGGCVPSEYDGTGDLHFYDHKTSELRRLLEGELRREQVVVFFRYNRELKRVRTLLQERGIPCDAIMGSMPVEKRRAIVHRFRSGRFRVLLLQAKCARYALPLSCARTAIFFSNWWDWLTRLQCEARLHGPNNNPLYIDLVTKHTTDEGVVKALRGKKIAANALINKVREYCREHHA